MINQCEKQSISETGYRYGNPSVITVLKPRIFRKIVFRKNESTD